MASFSQVTLIRRPTESQIGSRPSGDLRAEEVGQDRHTDQTYHATKRVRAAGRPRTIGIARRSARPQRKLVYKSSGVLRRNVEPIDSSRAVSSSTDAAVLRAPAAFSINSYVPAVSK